MIRYKLMTSIEIFIFLNHQTFLILNEALFSLKYFRLLKFINNFLNVNQ
jgi:hypothetical protein